MGKLQRCKQTIKQWVRKKKQPTEVLIQEETKELAKIQEEASSHAGYIEKALKDELNALMEQEDLRW